MPVSTIIGHFPYFGLFITLLLGGLGFPFPEGVTLIVCGFLISTHVMKLLPALSVAYSGVLIGDLLAYYLGRKYGRMIVTHKIFRRIISPERLSKLEDKFNNKRTFLIMIGGHLLGEIFLVAGVMRMPVHKFLIADAIASLFAIAIWTGIGYIGGNSLEIIKEDISRVEHIGILFAIIVISIYLLFRYFKSRSDRTTQ